MDYMTKLSILIKLFIMKINLERTNKYYKNKIKNINIFMLVIFFISIFFLITTSSIDVLNDINFNIIHHSVCLDNDEIKFNNGIDNLHLDFVKLQFLDILISFPRSTIHISHIPQDKTNYFSFNKSNVELNKFQTWTRSTFS